MPDRKNPHRWRLRDVNKGLLLVVSVLVALPIFYIVENINSSGNHRAMADMMKCMGQMRQIGLSLHLYAAANGNCFPDSLAQLVTEPAGLLYGTDASALTVLQCPSMPGKSAEMSPVAIRRQLEAGSYGTYIYRGSGKRLGQATDTIILYEPPESHWHRMNVLRTDGSVDILEPEAAKRFLESLAVTQASSRPTDRR